MKVDINKFKDIKFETRDRCMVCGEKIQKSLIDMPDFPMTEIYNDVQSKEKVGFVDQGFQFCTKCGHGQLQNVIDISLQYGDTFSYHFRTSESASGRQSADFFVKFLDKALAESDDILGDMTDLLGDIPISMEGIDELKQIREFLDRMNVPKERAEIDITIVRGLGYYTGPVFETTLNDLPEYGSMFSGGRYDNLLNRFSSQSIPAVGTSFGVDRMLAALIALEAIELQKR